jgi:hypothetical protein
MAGASSLLLDEHFAAGDARFVDEVLASTSGKRLKGLAERWSKDSRHFAREALHRYIDDGCDRPHHRPLVKGLFKRAERAGDDETMAHFLVAFDRLQKRKIRTVERWDYQQNASVKTVVIDDDQSVHRTSQGENDPRFSIRTRRYLQRRAFRYFRRIGGKDPARYGRAVRAALALYQDAHLDTAQKLLDSWGLVHVLYGRSPVLSRVPRGVVLTPGCVLSELGPAPIHPDSWKGCLGDLITLLKKAQSRTVRAFVLDVLRRDYASSLHTIPVLRLRALLLSPHEETQTFAAELLRNARDIHLLPIADWLELLAIETPTALDIVCQLVAKHVSPSRLSLADCVALGCQRPAPVAELGLTWARSKRIAGEADLLAILAFAKAESPLVRDQAVLWVTEVLGKSLETKPAHVRELLDSRHSDVRGRAMTLISADPRFRDAQVLWLALTESPYDDVRAYLVRHLEDRGAAVPEGSLRQLWATVLLGVHRGSRSKRRALTQIAAKIAGTPDQAESLLPLLAIALRSVRPPERRAALAAVAAAAARAPSLIQALARTLPEIRIESTEAIR